MVNTCCLCCRTPVLSSLLINCATFSVLSPEEASEYVLVMFQKVTIN